MVATHHADHCTKVSTCVGGCWPHPIRAHQYLRTIVWGARARKYTQSAGIDLRGHARHPKFAYKSFTKDMNMSITGFGSLLRG